MGRSEDIRPIAPLDRDTPLVRSREVLVTELGTDEAVMLDIARGSYFGVRGVARVIWDALEVPVTLAEVVERVRSRHPSIDPNLCERDARDFLEELLHNSLAYPHVGSTSD